MKKKIDKLLLGILSFMALLSFTLLIDYLLPGEDKEEGILVVGTKIAAGTRGGARATSYTLSTPSSSSFYVNEFDYFKADEGDSILLNVSPIYGEVNSYQLIDKMKNSNSPPTRFLTSLLLPLIIIGLCVAAYFVKETPQLIWAGLLVSIITIIIFFA
jgi:tetrahydromethanopterin S-methyltransferase subunit B